MYKWLWIAPVLLLLGCSKSTPPATGTQSAKSTQAVVQPADPGGGTIPPATPTAPPADPGIEIPRGTPLHVRIDEAVSTRGSRTGDGFSATLAEPVVMDNRTLLPAGTKLSGHVTISDASGRFKGRARLGLRLDSLEYHGRKYRIETTSADRVSANHRRRNTAIIGGGSGLGAIVGAIAGGGKGALIGAGAGAAAGVAGEAITGKKEVSIPAETLLRFTLEAPVHV